MSITPYTMSFQTRESIFIENFLTGQKTQFFVQLKKITEQKTE